MRFFRSSAALSSLLVLVVASASGCRTGAGLLKPVHSATDKNPLPLTDLNGNAVDPFANSQTNVFIFVLTDCPVSNRYAPELNRLREKFEPRGAHFWLVYPGADTTPDEIQNHLRAYRLSLAPLRDPKHTLVRLAQARTTPEAAVFIPGPRLVYHGRIDNRFTAPGKERPAPTIRDLETILEKLPDRIPTQSAGEPAVGCYISPL
jgi:hypothetical protein